MKLLLILLLAFGIENLYAQKQGHAAVDSLVQELSKAKGDTNKVNLLNYISHEYTRVNTDKGLNYAQQAVDLSTKIEWKKGIAISTTYLGQNYEYKNDYANALVYYTKALKLNGEIGNKPGIALATGYMGSLYGQHSDYPKQLEYYFKALKIYEETGDKKRIAWITGSIGGVYNAQSDYPKALDYFFKTLKMDEEMGDKSNFAINCNNIGAIYEEQGDYHKSLTYQFKALRIAEEIEDNYTIAYIDGDIGVVYTHLKYYTKGIEFEQKAFKMAKETGDKHNAAWQLEYIGDAYLSSVSDPAATINRQGLQWDEVADSSALQQGKYPLAEAPEHSLHESKATRLHTAIDYLQQSIAISKETHNLDVLIECYKNIAKAYILNGDYKQALEYTNNYVAIKDSVFSKKNNDNIVKMGLDIEYEQKTADAEKAAALKLQRQKNFTYSGIAGILLLTGFSFFIVKERRKSEKLLLNILPSEVAAELKAKGSAEAKSFDDVTVLFTDFKGFTNISEKLTAKELVEAIDYCFKGFDGIMDKYNIEKIKTIGDSYMAAGGLPVKNKTHAADVVNAALEIRDFMEMHKQKRIAEGKEVFEIRIGVHTGPVVAGIVGVKKFAYDIWGDTVNTASRLESSGEAGKVNISATTYELVKNKFTCTYRGKVEAKKKGMIDMYFVG